MPRVSIVTPSYNAAPYLRAAIESVLAQDYPEIEYLVMDGGSDDGTVELLKSYGGKFRWVSERDAGQSDAIARGFEMTGGAIIGWLNADDLLKPGAVTAAVEAFQARPEAAVVYGDADFIDCEGRFIAPCSVVEPYSRQRLLYYGDYLIQPASFFTREAYQAVGGLDRSLHWAMDWDLWLKLAERYPFVYLPREMASYRWLGSNKSAEGGFDRLKEVERVARRHGCDGLPAYFRLEEARLHAAEALGDLRGLRPGAALAKAGRTAATLLSSPRALISLLNPHIWRNFRTSRLLSRRAAVTERERS